MKHLLCSLIATLLLAAGSAPAQLYPVLTDSSARTFPGGVTNLALLNGTNVFSGFNTLTIDAAGLLRFGGATASYPSLKRSSTELQVRLADDSGGAPLRTGTLSVDNGNLLVPYGEVQFNGASWVFDTSYQMRAAPYARIQWVPGGNWLGAQDTELGRAGVGTVGIWNKDNVGCALKIHGVYTNDTNYVRASLSATTNAVTLAAETSGSGSADVNINLTPAGAGGVVIGTGGAAIHKVLSATATLNFDLTAVDVEDLTITVTGAAVGNVVALGVPHGSVTATAQFSGWVSAADTVTVRCRVAPGAAENPASGTFRATVIKH